MTDAPAGKVALVIGAGDATGRAIARRFAREGYTACVTRRNADKLQPLVDADPGRGRRGAWLCLRRAQGRPGRGPLRRHRVRDRADRGVRVQHRRQRPVEHPRRDAAHVLQGVGNGLLRGLPDRPGRGEAHGRPPARHHPVHRRHRRAARQRGLRGVRDRQARPARAGAEHGARARAEEHPRGARRDRRRDRYRVHPRRTSPTSTPPRTRTASSPPSTSPTRTGTCTASRATHGRTSWTCGRGWSAGSRTTSTLNDRARQHEHEVRRVLLRLRQPRRLPGVDAAARHRGRAAARRWSTGRCCSAASSRPPATRQPATVPAKGKYMLTDLGALRRALRRAAALQPALPDQHAGVDARRGRRCRLREPQRFEGYVAAMFRAMWVEGRNMGDPAISPRRSPGGLRSAGRARARGRPRPSRTH